MGRFISNPVILTMRAPEGIYKRADVEIQGVDHSKASFEGRLFINLSDAGPETPTTDEHYIGSFWVFGHGGCAGDEGHCEPRKDRRPFDFRAEHQLTPMSERVIVTEKLKQLTEPGQEFALSIVPRVRPANAELLPDSLVTDLLQFDQVLLLTYQ